MTIQLTRVEEFALITLDRPQALNALSFALIRDMARVLDEVAQSDARALLIVGAGQKAFCAGADIKELTGRSLMEQKRGAELGQATFGKIERLPVPSVAIVNGYAFGGGLEMALACTFRIATRNAKMGLPEIKLGLIPGYGGTQRLPRLVGRGRALQLILSGGMIGAQEAYRIGLVNEVVPAAALIARAEEILDQIFGNAPLAVKFAIEAVNKGLETSQAEGLVMESSFFALCASTDDKKEGTSAFLEKRAPKFAGR
jgi:enoyl-CoA hydratase